MRYDFDSLPDRLGTNCAKWDGAIARLEREDGLGMGIADMDFPAPKEVIDALTKRVKHGVFGYGNEDPAYYEAIMGWFSRRFDLELRREWIVQTSGVVSSFHWCILALTQPGDGVVVQTPVYGPIITHPELAGRTLIKNHLICSSDGTWIMDFDALDEQLSDAKMMILCSPHNPIGRVWKHHELKRVVDLCEKHNVILVSDEIHCDLTMPEVKHTPLLKFPAAETIGVMCSAPSKTFNMPGLGIANVFIANSALRARFVDYMSKHSLHSCNILGEVACKAAYTYCDDWVDAVMCTVAKNYATLAAYLAENCPRIGISTMEGTYLAWLDMRDILLTEPEIREFFERSAGILGSSGEWFGAPGYYRLNLATSPERVNNAMNRIGRAYQGLFEG